MRGSRNRASTTADGQEIHYFFTQIDLNRGILARPGFGVYAFMHTEYIYVGLRGFI
jgi:hypothetical protein